ncbi:MAG: DivIVA domain-containing protein, partial [Atopobiaceae bacterium]|nr:DivIVA domain-containing protein [Atopobiaceae bacterium]
MAITPADIEQLTFSPSKHGYDTEEVDAFLEQLTVEIDQMLQKIADLKGRLNKAEADLADSQAEVAALEAKANVAPVAAAPAPQNNMLSASERQISQALIVAQQ